MGKTKGYILSIGEPCQESWTEMKPQGCGRFCNSCQNVVHDLTNLSNEALLKWLDGQNGPVCGRLAVDQLNKPLNIQGPIKNKRLYKMIAGLLAMTSLSSVLSGTAQKPSGGSFKTEQLPIKRQPSPDVKDSLSFSVYGIVSDSISGKPIVNASILIDDKVIAVSDSNGQYSFVLPSRYRKTIVEITAEKFGSHAPVKDIVRLSKLPGALNFTLKEYEKTVHTITFGMITILPVEKRHKNVPLKKSWLQKIFTTADKK